MAFIMVAFLTLPSRAGRGSLAISTRSVRLASAVTVSFSIRSCSCRQTLASDHWDLLLGLLPGFADWPCLWPSACSTPSGVCVGAPSATLAGASLGVLPLSLLGLTFSALLRPFGGLGLRLGRSPLEPLSGVCRYSPVRPLLGRWEGVLAPFTPLGRTVSRPLGSGAALPFLGRVPVAGCEVYLTPAPGLHAFANDAC